MNLIKKLVAVALLLLITSNAFIVASNNECIDVLKTILNINNTLSFTDGKYFKLEFIQTFKYINPKSKKESTINDKCTLIYSYGKTYFKNNDSEYLKTKNKVVFIDHAERVICISDSRPQDLKKIESYNTFLADSIISGCKIESCQKVSLSSNLYSITLIPDKKKQQRIGGINRINYVYDTSNMTLKEYHASYNLARSSIESIDYNFTCWYTPVNEKSIVDLVSMLKNNKLSKRYPNYKIINSTKK
jgi:hypothetical protein